MIFPLVRARCCSHGHGHEVATEKLSIGEVQQRKPGSTSREVEGVLPVAALRGHRRGVTVLCHVDVGEGPRVRNEDTESEIEGSMNN